MFASRIFDVKQRNMMPTLRIFNLKQSIMMFGSRIFDVKQRNMMPTLRILNLKQSI